MRLPHRLDIMERQRRILRTHLGHSADLRELLEHRLHRERILHQRLLAHRIVIDAQRLLVERRILHERIRRNSRILLNLPRLTELILRRHKIAHERLRCAQILRNLAALIRRRINPLGNIGAHGSERMIGKNLHRRHHKIHRRALQIIHRLLHIRATHKHMTRFIRRRTRLTERIIRIARARRRRHKPLTNLAEHPARRIESPRSRIPRLFRKRSCFLRCARRLLLCFSIQIVHIRKIRFSIKCHCLFLLGTHPANSNCRSSSPELPQ